MPNTPQAVPRISHMHHGLLRSKTEDEPRTNSDIFNFICQHFSFGHTHGVRLSCGVVGCYPLHLYVCEKCA